MNERGTPGRWPDFLIVGAPKCGTTAMNDFLSQHPGIFMAQKELTYFGDENHRLTEQQYKAHFRGARPGQLVGEASVAYFASPSAPYAIRDAIPDARIVVMLRDPFEVIPALHAELVFVGSEPLKEISRALAAEADRRRALPPHLTSQYLYREQVDYSRHLHRWREVFGEDRVHVVVFDDFRADNLGTYHGVLRFIGADGSHIPVLRTVNARKQPRIYPLHRFILNHPEWLRRMSHRVLPDSIRRRAWRAALRMNSRRAPRRSLPAAYEGELSLELAPGLRRLEVMLHRRLDGWCVIQ